MIGKDPRSVLARLEQTARRRFGQHFLTDTTVVDRIVSGSKLVAGDRVVEVGPGLGILTSALVAAGAKVTAVELDRDLAAYLRTELPGITLVEGDAARVDWAVIVPEPPAKLVSNLPYNVGTTVTMQVLRRPDRFTSATVMLQLEVVQRLCAESGSKTYGALSVEAQVRARPVFITKVGPGRFFPPPKVDSAVVRLEMFERPRTGTVAPDDFDRVVKAAFSQRRKTLLNAVSSVFGRERTAEALRVAGVDAGLRAEQLPVEGFVALATAIYPVV